MHSVVLGRSVVRFCVLRLCRLIRDNTQTHALVPDGQKRLRNVSGMLGESMLNADDSFEAAVLFCASDI